MPNCDSSLSSSSRSVGGYREVVIIGNGPSGLCLSYFLSGHWPYWNKNQVSDEYLQMRLSHCDNGLSLVEQDLAYLSDGLEGRSLNQVALLYDKLKHPDGDLGIDTMSCLSWKYDPLKEIDHICIGKTAGPGGSWNDLDGSQLTISPSRWMELPDMSYNDWKRQSRTLMNMNAGLVFSSKNSNFSEDNSLLNGNYMNKKSITSPNKSLIQKQLSTEESRASMHDIRNYYRDYVKQKNLDKYLLNNATVTSVRKIYCNKLNSNSASTNECTLIPSNNSNLNPNSASFWEVTGLIDKRDRKKASSLTHKGDLAEFKFYCKHLILANGACDLHNELKVKGENSRFILKSIRELEDKIKEDLSRLQKDPLLIVGSGLTAADAIMLAQKHHIRIIHVIRRSVHDQSLIFNKLPKKIYPEYQRVYEKMVHYRYNNNELKRPFSQNDLNSEINNNSNVDNTSKSYVLYDEHQVKYFTSKRTCVLANLSQNVSQQDQFNDKQKCLNQSNLNRHLHIQNKHHQSHQKQLKEFDEEHEYSEICNDNDTGFANKLKHNEIEFKISYACVLIGYSPDLEFLPSYITNELAVDPLRPLNTKDNPISIDEITHETSRFKNLYAMGPLVGDNFIRFGTGGALAITSSIWKNKLKENHK